MKFFRVVILMTVLLVINGCAGRQQQARPMDASVLIDVRIDSEWKDGHLDGAILIPHDRIAEGITAVAPDKFTRIYLYCRTGRRSGLAYDTLKKAGYQDVVNLGTMENASKTLDRQIVK